MGKFALISLKIFLWILLGIILKLILDKSKALKTIKYLITKSIDIIIYLLVPLFILTTTWKIGIQGKTTIIIFICFMLIFFAELLISKKFAKITNFDFKQIFFCLAFFNTLYLGIPITHYLVSNEATYYAIVYSIILVIFQFSVGVFMLSAKASISLLFSPVIYATLFGLILNKYQIPIPYFLNQAVNISALILTPIMLSFIGFSLSLSNVLENIRKHLFITLIGRILISFVIATLFAITLKFFFCPKIERDFLKALILISILPSAITNFVIFKKMNLDTNFVSGEILWGTVVILAVLPYLNETLEVILLAIF